MRESAEQAAFVEWFRLQFPRTIIASIPNGAHLAGDAKDRARQMAKLKWEGLVPGMPDLCIPEWGPLWIEFKREKGGVVSENQKNIMGYLRGIGQPVIVAYGCDDGIRQVQALRAEAA